MPVEPPRILLAPVAWKGRRLDLFLAAHLEGVSRSRVQFLLEREQVLVDGTAPKPSRKLRGGESIAILGDPQPPPLRAEPEAIPLTVVYEDPDLAVVNKPAGMMVHAGAGSPETAGRGTLVNALLHRFRTLSAGGGPLRPGIVHRLDKQTSGLILVAKNDATHARLAAMFSRRRIRKTYLALVHGALPRDEGTITAPIARDAVRRTRMTTRMTARTTTRLPTGVTAGMAAGRAVGRSAITHWSVLQRVDGAYGRFTLLSVRIETGRTHQIRVHLASLGFPIVGDALYGAPGAIPARPVGGGRAAAGGRARLSLSRNFLHASELEFVHPSTGGVVSLSAELPADLRSFLERLQGEVALADDPSE